MRGPFRRMQRVCQWPLTPERPPHSELHGVGPATPKRVRIEEAEDVSGEHSLLAAGETYSADDEPDAKRTHLGSESNSPAAAAHVDPVPGGMELIAVVGANGLSPATKPPGRLNVCKCFSPPRIAARAPQRGFRVGWNLDLVHVDGPTCRLCDLSGLSVGAVFNMVKKDKPRLTVLSPPCTKLCNLWIIMGRVAPRNEWLHAVTMVNVAICIIQLQFDSEREFAFEYLLPARSWRHLGFRRLRIQAGGLEATIHMCVFCLTLPDCNRSGLAKPIRILTSAMIIRHSMSRMCDGQRAMCSSFLDERNHYKHHRILRRNPARAGGRDHVPRQRVFSQPTNPQTERPTNQTYKKKSK